MLGLAFEGTLRGGGRTGPLQVGFPLHNPIEQTALDGSGDFLRLGSPDILSDLGGKNVAQFVVVELLRLSCPVLCRQIILVLRINSSVFLLEFLGLGLVRDPPGLREGVPAGCGHTADLAVIPLLY